MGMREHVADVVRVEQADARGAADNQAALVGELTVELAQRGRIVSQNRAAGVVRLKIGDAAERNVDASVDFQQSRPLQLEPGIQSPIFRCNCRLRNTSSRRCDRSLAYSECRSPALC